MSFYGRGRVSARVRGQLNSFWAMLGCVFFFLNTKKKYHSGGVFRMGGGEWRNVCPVLRKDGEGGKLGRFSWRVDQLSQPNKRRRFWGLT